MWKALPKFVRLLRHLVRAAASRTFWTAGSNNPIRIAMIAITTSSSISVKPKRGRARVIKTPYEGGTKNRAVNEVAGETRVGEKNRCQVCTPVGKPPVR